MGLYYNKMIRMNTTNQKTKYWVSMTDKALSGWGLAEGKINKYVIEVDTYEEAQIVAENAGYRSEMKYINICMNKPRYNEKYYLTSFRTKDQVPSFLTKGYFK